MRIAYVCADAGIPVFGCKGASVHVQEVLRALVKKGASVVLFASRFGGNPPPDLRSVQLCSLPAIPGKDAQLRARVALESNQQLAEALQQRGPFDLVYERYSLWSYAALEYASRQGWKTVLEVNAPLIEEQRNYRQMVAEEKASQVLRRLMVSAAVIIAVSPGVKAYLNDFFPSAENIHVIANGVDSQRFTPAVRQSLSSVPQDAVVIGFLGTLKPWHGVDTLIAAFAQLHSQRPHTRLLIVGDGPEKARLSEQVADTRLLADVIFTGRVEPAGVPQWLALMDIAVAPYPELAGFYFSPLKIYEYMASGLPVVASRVGHLAEVISHDETGLLVAPDKPAELARTLQQLVDDPAWRKRLGEAASQHVLHCHSWLAVVDEILRLVGLNTGRKA